MPKIYRAAQHWNQWLSRPLGHCVVKAEKNFLAKCLAAFQGKYGVLIGVPEQIDLLKTSAMRHQILLTPLINKNNSVNTIESDLYEFPIASGSVDLVYLPHCLEHTDNARQLLAEACRIVKPEGHIVILGFNPWSLWGLRKSLMREKYMPWNNPFIQRSTVTKWLSLADFELVKQDFILYSPPLRQHSLYLKLKFLDGVGRLCFKPFGGVYVLVAKAKVIPLTPIRLRWEQSFSNIGISLPGPSMRKF